MLVAASVRYRFFNAGCWKIEREREREYTQLRSRIFMNIHRTGEDIDKNSMTLTKEITARGGKKNKRRNKFEVGCDQTHSI